MAVFRATAADLRVLRKVQPLLFGHYAWTPEMRRIEDAGSGIFVAPRLGLSAKHVSKGYERLDPQIEAARRRLTPLEPQYAVHKKKTDFATLVHQAPRGNEIVNWGVTVDWASPDTDITFMQVEPITAGAERVEPEFKYLDWQLLPPHVGAMVRVYGWPKQDVSIGDSAHDQNVELWVEPARVVEMVYPMQAHGFGEFPSFRIDRELPHGFSGGPVLYDDVLVGIFSGPDLVASLWPLTLHTYPCLDETEHSVVELIEEGTIVVKDWDQVKGRVARQPCDIALAGSPIQTRCGRQHVILT